MWGIENEENRWDIDKIQWLIILIAGIFLLFHGHNHDFVIVLWYFLLCVMLFGQEDIVLRM